jgi:hypothetical protein
MTAPTFAMVKIAAHGRWPEILAGLGIDPAALRNRHGPCPGCGGIDRFRFDDKDDGRFYCGGGGEPVSGDGFALLQHVYGWTAREALERVSDGCWYASGHAAMRRSADATGPARPPEPSRTAAYALDLWRMANTDDNAVGTHPYAVARRASLGRWSRSCDRIRGIRSWAMARLPGDPDQDDGLSAWSSVQCINTAGREADLRADGRGRLPDSRQHP